MLFIYKILSFFSKASNELGIVTDPRSATARQKDFQHEELMSGGPIVNWIEKTKYKTYSLREQNGSSSCVGQAHAKSLEILTGNVISAHPTYRQRSNFPEQGMWMQDAFDILKHKGTCFESIDPSQNQSEDEMNRPVIVTTPIKIKAYIFLRRDDIDQIADALEQGRAPVMTLKFGDSEWVDVPKVNPKAVKMTGHEIAITDYTLWRGQKCLVIDDSWGKATSIGNGGQRLITEEYLKARATAVGYPILDIENPIEKPTYTFIYPLSYGMTNDAVIHLQKILYYEGFFPTKSFTGYYGPITANGVLKWQLKHSVDTAEVLQRLGGKYWGNKSIGISNSLYS